MTSSKFVPAEWQTDTRLQARAQAPRFVRTHWDERAARAFGPWRVADAIEPTEGQTRPAPVLPAASGAALGTQALAAPTGLTDPGLEAVQVEPLPAVDAAQLQALHDAAYQQGLADGRAQARAELRAEIQAELLSQQDDALQAERQRERELLRHLGIELRALQQDPQRFFEPLKRLALHVAEQLVRGELQVSGRAVERLVQQCLQQIEHLQPPVEVQLHPDDLAQLQTLGEAATEHFKLQADPELRPGSVRVRVHDTVVQDFIEHRLEPLARRLLAEPDAWLGRSRLLSKLQAEALPEDTPQRQWARRTADVQDTPVRPAGAETAAAASPADRDSDMHRALDSLQDDSLPDHENRSTPDTPAPSAPSSTEHPDDGL